jgi:hypothetical protein
MEKMASSHFLGAPGSVLAFNETRAQLHQFLITFVVDKRRKHGQMDESALSRSTDVSQSKHSRPSDLKQLPRLSSFGIVCAALVARSP